MLMLLSLPTLLPAPIEFFTDICLDASIMKNIAIHEYSTPTSIQAQAMPVALSGKDLLSCSETGSGKTADFSIPMIQVLKVQSDCLLPANPEILDGVNDLSKLSYLSEPSVLYNLQYRYDRDMIYSKAGPVLVAINSYKPIPYYGNDYIEAYGRKKMHSPHVYAIDDTAIREMIRGHIIHLISFV